MYTAIIIDDEYLAQEVLKKLIQRFFPGKFDEIYCANSVNEGVELIRKHNPDLVFLDIHMPNEYGFKLFDYFDEIKFEVVFSTAHSNYVMEAVNKWGCLGYLMKPVSINDLKIVIDRFEARFSEKNQIETKVNEVVTFENASQPNVVKSVLNEDYGILLFSTLNEIIFIKKADIIYCKADDNYCEIYTTNKMYTISKPLKEIEKSINKTLFIRIHRSYLVNLDYSKRLDKKNNVLVLSSTNNDEEILIPVTASGLKILMNAIS